MHADDAARFPALAEKLEQLAGMQRRSMEDEFDNLVSFAREALAGEGLAPFRTQVSSLDVLVRRADSTVVSLLSDSYTDVALIEGYRAFHGINLDAGTGEELTIRDVITNTDGMVQVIKRELNGHMWAGEFYSETAVEDYFRNTPDDGFSWTLDYNGITFYFMPGDLCEPGFGHQIATVSFADHPELFAEAYRVEPAAYIAELPISASFFANFDDRPDLEELNVTAFQEDKTGACYAFGLYSDIDGQYYYEEREAVAYHPYYVKTADGRHYLYLFTDRTEEGSRDMRLLVFDLYGSRFTRVGEMNASLGFLYPDSFLQPTDPDGFRLDNRETAEQEEIYQTGDGGMPVQKQ